MPERNTPLPPGFGLAITARREGDLLLGGEPFAIARGDADPRWLVMRNLAQPIPPPAPAPPVTAVIPVRDRPIDRLLAALDVDETIVVDDASETDVVRKPPSAPARATSAARRAGERGPRATTGSRPRATTWSR